MVILTIDVTTETLNKVETTLRAEGFKPFEVELGGQGVGILETVPNSLAEEFTHAIGSIARELGWTYWG